MHTFWNVYGKKIAWNVCYVSHENVLQMNGANELRETS